MRKQDHERTIRSEPAPAEIPIRAIVDVVVVRGGEILSTGTEAEDIVTPFVPNRYVMSDGIAVAYGLVFFERSCIRCIEIGSGVIGELIIALTRPTLPMIIPTLP